MVFQEFLVFLVFQGFRADLAFPALQVFLVYLVFLEDLVFPVAAFPASVELADFLVVVLAGSLVAALAVFLADLVFQGLASLGLVVQVFPDLAVSQGGQDSAV